MNNEQTTQASKGLNLPTAIVVAAIVIGGAIFLRGNAENASPAVAGDASDSLVPAVTDSDFIRGNVGAPITVIEYADFSCGYCGVYHPTLTRLVAESEGQVRWVYRHLPIFNIEAATAGQCVGTLAGDEAFFKFADTLFANKDKYSTDFYRETAITAGADADAYDTCFSDPLVSGRIKNDFTRTRILLGFSGTPQTIIIDKNGKEFSFAGALPYEDVASVIQGLD